MKVGKQATDQSNTGDGAAVSDTVPDGEICALHANPFKLLTVVQRLSPRDRLRATEYAREFIPARHLIHALLRDAAAEHDRLAAKRGHNRNNGGDYWSTTGLAVDEHTRLIDAADKNQYNNNGTVDGKKKRRVIRLLNSTSNRSVAHVYESYWRSLQQYRDSCRLQPDWQHTAYGVHTNFSHGDDTEMAEEENELMSLSAAKPFPFGATAYSTITNTDAAAADARTMNNATSAQPRFAFRSVDQPTGTSTKATRKIDVATIDGMVRDHYTDEFDDDDDDVNDDNYDRGARKTTSPSIALFAYMQHPIHRRAIHSLNYALRSGDECWSLWGETVDRALRVYRVRRLYPVKDSLFDLTVVLGERRHVAIPLHGITTKVGSLLDFTVSLRQLMRHTMLTACYELRKSTRQRSHYTSRHECTLPANSQGVYHEVFLTGRQGHDLLCRIELTDTPRARQWLWLFEETREMMAGRGVFEHTATLRQHLTMLQQQ